MCNVKVPILAVSIEEIEKMLKTKENENPQTISINKITKLSEDLIIFDDIKLGDVSIEALKNLIAIKKFYKNSLVPIREIEALRDGWKFDDHWTNKEADFYLFLNYPGVQINLQKTINLRNVLFYLKKLQKEAEIKKVDSIIDELIQEFLQVEQIFYCCPNTKIFSSSHNNLTDDFDGLEIFLREILRNKKLFFESDFLFIQQLMFKALNVEDQIRGVRTYAFEKALKEFSKNLKPIKTK